MGERKGDDAKRPEECKLKTRQGDGFGVCPHLKETSSSTDFDGETYDCKVCGEHYRLYYEDMA